MSRRMTALLVIVLALCLGLNLAAPSRAYCEAAPQILGKTYGEWSAQWWQWALTEPVATNPLLDNTGEFAGLNQKGPVWFLAGTITGNPETRHVSIPKGKYIFFPIVNTIIASGPYLGEPLTEKQERLDASAYINTFGSDISDPFPKFVCTLDDIQVVFNPNTPIVRTQSPAFTLHLYTGNLFGVPESDNFPCISDGYWVMLPPLSAGTHTLYFKATSPSGSQELTYVLTVK
jgi:hypothetical protein